MYRVGAIREVGVRVINKTSEVLGLWSLWWEDTDIIYKQINEYKW